MEIIITEEEKGSRSKVRKFDSPEVMALAERANRHVSENAMKNLQALGKDHQRAQHSAHLRRLHTLPQTRTE